MGITNFNVQRADIALGLLPKLRYDERKIFQTLTERKMKMNLTINVTHFVLIIQILLVSRHGCQI